MSFNKIRHTIVRFCYEQILYEIIQNYWYEHSERMPRFSQSLSQALLLQKGTQKFFAKLK